jgi:hypothetical protein
VTTLVLVAFAILERVYNHDDRMASWSRFHLEEERRLEGKLMEVDSEDRVYDQLSLSSS